MTDLQGPPIPGSKRRRLRGSCDKCRSRKIRCDSSQMPGNRCSNCISFNTECTHTATKATSKTPETQAAPKEKTPQVTEGISDVRAHVAAIVSQATSYIKDADVRGILLDVARYARRLENQLESNSRSPSLASSPGAANSPPPQRIKEEDEDSVNGILTERFDRFSLDYELDRYFGPSSHFDLISTAMDIKESFENPSLPKEVGPSTKRPLFWRSPWEYDHLEREEVFPPLIFPEPDLLQSLVELYFTKVNIILTLLHRHSFEESLASGLHFVDRQFGSTVLGVCALAAKYSDDPRVLLEGTNSRLSAGWKYFCQLDPRRQSFLKPFTIYEAQVICLYIFYGQGSSAPDGCWGMSGNGIRYAQEVGVHLRGRFEDKVLDERWKRVFWSLLCIDTLGSSFSGRPRATTFDDYTIDYPIECDDEYWQPSDPAMAFKQPPGTPSVMSYAAVFFKLVEIIGIAQRTIFLVNRKNQSTTSILDAVAHIDSALNAWSDTIPEHLRWDPHIENPIFAVQSAVLYSCYYNVQMQVHRIFITPALECAIPGGPSRNNYSSIAICASSARACIHVVDTTVKKGLLCDPHILHSVFDACILLLLNVWGGRYIGLVIDPKKCLQDVDSCLRIFRAYETRWQLAGRQHDIIMELMNAVHVDTQYTPNPLKRTRDHDPEPSADVLPELDDWSSQPSFSSIPSSVDADSLFALPLHTEDLGRLPVYQPLDFGKGPLDGMSFPNPVADISIAPEFAANPDLNSVRIPDSLALLTGTPAGYDWDDWGKYITSMEELIQNLDRPDLNTVVT
ncbi:fungal-specific transcription factor domain-containing protein [Mycena metata]|uniref:Fungal-specific transcription factor domain-containing protein n=1 Tax=Mycena metata TaxID=1033252 RepID=A0AAD7JI19_9AGAR|nr:fungal-specific transcription factor domain-containing protein [Mycena metata]